MTVLPLSPGEVIAQHVQLTDRLMHPNDAMADFLGYNMALAIGRHGSKARTYLFFPVLDGVDRAEDVSAAHGTHLAKILGHGLQDAITYQVTAEMVQAMAAVHDTTTAVVDHIDEAEMPCAAGFAWLDEPWMITPDYGSSAEPFAVRALSWQYTELWVEDDTKPTPAARLALWTYDADMPEGIRRYAPIGPLVLTHTALMIFGMRFSGPGKDSSESFFSLVHLLWMFLGMEIVATPRATLNRHARRRAARSLKHGEVRVVLLRRIAHHAEPSGEHRDVAWSCRWVVQGHYRHAEAPADPHRGVPAGGDKHCAVCHGELFWIRPYLKGPDGKPLHVADKTLMKLAR